MAPIAPAPNIAMDEAREYVPSPADNALRQMDYGKIQEENRESGTYRTHGIDSHRRILGGCEH